MAARSAPKESSKLATMRKKLEQFTYTQTSKAKSREGCISMPFNVRHEVGVTYNAAAAKFQGLPAEWTGKSRQFGLALQSYPKV